METEKPSTQMSAPLSELEAPPTTDAREARPQGGPRFDWLIAVLSAWWLGGLFLDGWAHRHVPALETFFTLWHAVLYSGFAACALALLVTQARNMRRGYPWRKSLPTGYGLSLAGAAIFLVAGALDLLWHTLFGVERSVEALLSPTHLLLATGGVLLVSGPLRAAWRRILTGARLTWRAGAPALLALLYCYAALGFFTQYAHPFVTNWAAIPVSAAPAHSDLYLMRADGSGQTRLTTNQGDARSPSFSPDGARIVFASATSAQATLEQIYMVNADGGDLRQLTFATGGASLPSWSPDGAHIAYTDGASGQIAIMDVDGANARLLTRDTGQHCCSTWSPDGAQIAYIGPDGQIYAIAASSPGAEAAPRRLTHNSVQHWTPRWSPDGARIAFSSNQDSNDAVYTMRVDGSDMRRLTTSGADNWGPVWSPDASRLAFATNRDGYAEIYVMRADGSDQVNLTRNPGVDNDGLPAWSADGRTIAYTVRRQSSPIMLDLTAALGVASVLLQAALLMGVLLLVMRRWRLPLGAITLLLVVSTALIGLLGDQHIWIVVALLAGLIADTLYVALRPSAERPTALRIFSFTVPTLLYGLYFLTTYLTHGHISWSIHLTAGTAALAGVVGLLLSIVLIPPALISQRKDSQTG
jgi:Tol biopolymer transport system component